MRLALDAPLLSKSLSLALLSAYAASTLAPTIASAALVNVTIDDTLGDQSNGNQILYQPPGKWNVGQDCNGCTAHPDPNLTLHGTWHDSSFNETGAVDPDSQVLTASVDFVGVAVYVFCITTRSFASPDGNSNMRFFVDGELAGEFVQPPDNNTAYDYNVPVYANTSLPPGHHTIVVANGQIGEAKSLLMLDYIVYTQGGDLTSSSSGSVATSPSSTFSGRSTDVPGTVSNGSASQADNTGSTHNTQKRTVTIAVATVCGVLGIAVAIIIIAYCCIRRRTGSNNASDSGIVPRSPSHIEVNPSTSGWAEGTWAAGAEEQAHSSLPSTPSTRRAGGLALGSRESSGRRRRGGSDAREAASPEASAPQSATRNPIRSPAILQNIPAFRFGLSQTRDDLPASPASSSWGTPANMAPPDSATYLIPVPAHRSTSNVNLDRLYSGVDESTTSLSSHHAHPFAKAQGVDTPLRRQRSGTTQSVPGTTANPPPSSMPPSVPTRPRGYSDRKVRPLPEPLSSGTTSPVTPASAQYSTTHTFETGESFLPSPSPADPSPLSDAARHPPVPEKQQLLRPSASQHRRRVDPVDPSLQPPRDAGQGRAHPFAGAAAQAMSHSEPRTRQQQQTGLASTPSQRDRRRRYGTVDVPVDAAVEDSQPPSYREAS